MDEFLKRREGRGGSILVFCFFDRYYLYVERGERERGMDWNDMEYYMHT